MTHTVESQAELELTEANVEQLNQAPLGALKLLLNKLEAKYNKIRLDFNGMAARYFRTPIASKKGYKEQEMIETLTELDKLKNSYLVVSSVIQDRTVRDLRFGD